MEKIVKVPKFAILLYELRYRLFGKKYVASIDVTDRCNLRCRHCYYKQYLKEKEDISLAEWEKRFKKYSQMGIRHANFLGGEPSLRYDVLKLAEKYFPFIAVATNGQIRLPKEFKRRIYLSLDGLEDENDRIRGKGSFAKAVKNYKNDKRGVVWCTLSKLNYQGAERLKQFIDFVRKMGVQGIRFELYTPLKGEDNSLLLSKSQRKEIGKVLLEELKRKDSILFATEDLVNYLVKPPKSIITDCAIKKKFYLFDAQGKRKTCFNPSADCTRCSCALGYWVPIYRFENWLAYKRMLYKMMFKLT